MNETENPIGFDETPPETPEDETGAHAVPCYDHVPRTIVPPLTNGGSIRCMNNHLLAEFLAFLSPDDAWGNGKNIDAWFDWLNQPCGGEKPDVSCSMTKSDIQRIIRDELAQYFAEVARRTSDTMKRIMPVTQCEKE